MDPIAAMICRRRLAVVFLYNCSDLVMMTFTVSCRPPSPLPTLSIFNWPIAVPLSEAQTRNANIVYVNGYRSWAPTRVNGHLGIYNILTVCRNIFWMSYLAFQSTCKQGIIDGENHPTLFNWNTYTIFFSNLSLSVFSRDQLVFQSVTLYKRDGAGLDLWWRLITSLGVLGNVLLTLLDSPSQVKLLAVDRPILDLLQRPDFRTSSAAEDKALFDVLTLVLDIGVTDHPPLDTGQTPGQQCGLWIALPPLAPHHLEVAGELHFSLNEIIVSVVGQLVDFPQVIQDLILPWRGQLAAAWPVTAEQLVLVLPRLVRLQPRLEQFDITDLTHSLSCGSPVLHLVKHVIRLFLVKLGQKSIFDGAECVDSLCSFHLPFSFDLWDNLVVVLNVFILSVGFRFESFLC